MNMFTNALAFYAGIRLIEAGLTELQPMFTVLMAVMTTANQMGRASSFTSTLQRAKASAINTFEILDRKPLIDPEMEGIEPKSVDGSVDMKDIRFAYPARPNIEIFKGNFEFHGKANTMIALVVSAFSWKCNVYCARW
jgi:ABC-type multidrug transport system fused ATPase/permease subunit